MPPLQWFFQLSLFLQLPPILFLVPPIWVHIPVPLQASCMTSDRWLNLSDSSFLILEVKLLWIPKWGPEKGRGAEGGARWRRGVGLEERRGGEGRSLGKGRDPSKFLPSAACLFWRG